MTGKARMLAAYRGEYADRIAIAPEFWYYYPARVLGVDMLEFERNVPFHLALKTTFETFDCEGWGVAFFDTPNPDISCKSREKWLDDDTLEVRHTCTTPHGVLTSAQHYRRSEPSWVVERPIKDFLRDLPAWKESVLGVPPESADPRAAVEAHAAVGDVYLLEGWLGVPFFDTVGSAFDGGLEAALFAFLEHEAILERLQEQYIDFMVRKAHVLCETTPFESFAIGCSWSCNSLIGPQMWRRWDKPVIRAVTEAVHQHDRLLHVHFHGRCAETVEDFAEIGIDCVCPFERPPGGDIEGLTGLQDVAHQLDRNVTMNGNIHTVETLIRGTPEDVRREVAEVMQAFAGNPRVIVGTGDQVGRETPEENLYTMIETAKELSPLYYREPDAN